MKPEGFRGIFREDEPARAVYSEGAGIAREIPSAVAVPADAADIEALVRWAAATGQSLIPRGSASGMAGGAVGPNVVVDLSPLRGIGPVNLKERTIRAEPGVICRTIDDAARAHGLRFPVDPSSAAFCTIGGMTSTNAAGPHSLKYGTMREWVRSLDCIFSDGSRASIVRGDQAPANEPVGRFLAAVPKLRKEWSHASSDHARVRKDSSGYGIGRYLESGELIDLIVGSEGTLAIVAAVELALSPVPKMTTSLLAAFSSLEDAARGATRARESGASACELLDKTFLEFAAADKDANPQLRAWAETAAAVLIAEVEADDSRGVERAASALREQLETEGAKTVQTALTPDSEKDVWELRHAASPILSRLTDVTSMQFIEDGAVPPEFLAEYVTGIRAALDRRGVTGVIFGHAGDAHAHVNPLIDLRLPDWRQTIADLLDDVVSLTARLGGTISAEHGDGRLRTPLLSRTWSESATSVFREVKRCFDPDNVFNPGVKVPLRGQRPIGSIKYDRSLPELPAAARAALDDLVARRGYADFRLSLIG